jgi:hypothetical protein
MYNNDILSTQCHLADHRSVGCCGNVATSLPEAVEDSLTGAVPGSLVSGLDRG